MIPGLGGFDPKKMQGMMKQLGISQEDIPAVKVTIELPDKNIIIDNPSVQKINVKGQHSFQITGDVTEESSSTIKEEDIKLVMEKTSSSREDALAALEETGDIAEAIMKLS